MPPVYHLYGTIVQKELTQTTMLRRIIYRLFQRRHYWRNLEFDEVAELYVSRLMTVFAINIINLFAAVYLYQLGYSLAFIAFFYAAIYAIKIPLSPMAGYLVAFLGPKRTIFIANLVRIPSLLFFLGVEEYGVLAVIAFGVVQQISACLYDLAYHVNFSKVKNTQFAGKEIGIMHMLEKGARVVAPVAGGVLATTVSPQATIALAAVVFSLAAWPLFRSAEPTRTGLKLEMHRVRFRDLWRTFAGQGVVGFDFVTSGLAWTLFMTVIVFANAGDNIYAVLGLIVSIGMVVSAAGAHAFGQMIDRRRGSALLTNAVILKSIVHMLRPISVTPLSAVANGFVSEVAATGQSMGFMRAMFDAADSSPSRFAYMTYMQIAVNLGATVACLVFGAALWLGGEVGGFAALFIVAAFVQFLMLLSRRYA